MQPNRLTSGGRINRNRSIRFRFNGKSYEGYEGDTLASALIANGVRVTARSFKYHRPRGIVGHGPEEPATLVELDGENQSGNNPVTTVSLTDGLSARSINCWPSPDFDIGGINQLLSRFIPAGFYYKTFKWPDWRLFEPSIRKAAGLANAPSKPPASGHFEARHAHTDILIAGAGPAGLQAALKAARAGKRVFLVDEGTEAGGSLLNRTLTIGDHSAMDWVADAVDELAAMDNVTHIQNATVWAYREHNMMIVNERCPVQDNVLERSWRVRAGEVVIATGAIERTLVFTGNDRPGVMLASSVQAYVNRYGVRPGQKVAFFTNNNSAYAVASDLRAAGIVVTAILDSRQTIPQAARDLADDIPVHSATVAAGTHGHKGIKAVLAKPLSGTSPGKWIGCDVLGLSGGWNPTVHLWSQSRSSVRYDDTLAAFVPDQAVQSCRAVGAAAGDLTLDGIVDGGADLDYAIDPLWRVDVPGQRGKAFLDIQNDVTVGDVHLALREGYDNIEHVKRYTTGGMGIDQGKTGNINIIGTVAMQQGLPLQEVGTTTFRSPYTPVSFGAINGLREDSVLFPYRHTPLTPWNIKNGAVMYEAGARWRRPGYFPVGDEGLQDAVNRECKAVRQGVGVYDGSPLGTYELKGADVPRFLDFIYTNIMSSLKPGNGRYGLMLSDDGLILDDGVTFRLDEHRWMMSTSTGHADSVYQHMDKLLHTDLAGWDVKITNITNQWNNATICGPEARKIVEALGTDIDLTNEAFPFMSFRDGTVAGIPARVVRVSFTGELSYEVNVAPRHISELWDKVMEVGKPFGILPVGSESSHVLRVEKGFLSLGHEVDGTADAYDLGMSWIMSKKKPDYLGKRAVLLRRAKDAVRRELVGILPQDPHRQVPEGAPLTPGGRKEATEGLVTACVWSVVNDRWVGLALLENGHARHGETAHVRLKDDTIPVTITKPVFHDPDGTLLRS